MFSRSYERRNVGRDIRKSVNSPNAELAISSHSHIREDVAEHFIVSTVEGSTVLIDLLQSEFSGGTL